MRKPLPLWYPWATLSFSGGFYGIVYYVMGLARSYPGSYSQFCDWEEGLLTAADFAQFGY